VSDRNVPSRENEYKKARIRLRRNTSLGAHGEPRHHSKVLDAAIYGTEGEDLNELVLTTAIAAMISMGAMALFKRC
jgi:hypothetical protein